MRPALILYAKAPAPGRVKTRLARSIGGHPAAALHEACVADAIERLLGLSGRADVELHTDVETDAWRDYAVTRRLQPAGDLGERMFGTLSAALEAGRPVAAIVGSDAPTLPVEYVESLMRNVADVALGPAADGGYWGIACRRAEPRMFAGVEWSSGRECEQTLAAAEACGLRTSRGEPWWDVDTIDDLRRLRDEGNAPRLTAEWIGENAGLF